MAPYCMQLSASSYVGWMLTPWAFAVADVQPFGPWIASLEWVAFAALHTRGAGWKVFEDAPPLVKRVFSYGELLPLTQHRPIVIDPILLP